MSVRITAEVSDLEKQLRSVQKSLNKTSEKMKDVGKVMTGALTIPVLAAAAAGYKLIQSASDMGETQSKVGVLFDISIHALTGSAT